MINIFDEMSVLTDIPNRRKTLFQKLMGNRIIDVLWHLPYSINNRERKFFLKDCVAGNYCTIIVEVSFHIASHALRKPAKIICTDKNDKIELLYFNTSKHYLAKIAPSGARIVISGKIEYDKNQKIWQMIHPDHVGGIETLNHWIGVEPVYHLTTGITQQMVRSMAHKSLSYLPKFPEWHSEELIKKFKWPSFNQCLHLLHNPMSLHELDYFYPAKMRLIFDEFLVQQLTLHLSRKHHTQIRSLMLKSKGTLVSELVKNLPFKLTNSQKKVYKEIESNLRGSVPMLRLLQGDVGSGKTIVAIMAMLHAVESGTQAAILAPTEILARQHYAIIKKYIDKLGITSEILTSREKGKVRNNILQGISSGKIQIIIGTHAIIQDQVTFKRLAFVVIDEQQRFGVKQRLQLSQKGNNPHILTMTATPIPRTMLIANYGEMDVSVITEKPKGRQEIKTKLVSINRLNEISAGVKKFLDQGEKIYWVCPLITESETLNYTHVQERFEYLDKIYPKHVGFVHGKMKGVEKDIIMEKFANGNINIVIATTIIEVGVDVPLATLMIIEHAERFGLAQLHQLRGRVGRSDKQSLCILVYGENIGESARKRLETMRQSNDGFFIAEEDLKLRGGGEIQGTKQSGIPKYKIANFNCEDYKARKLQHELLKLANDQAIEIIKENNIEDLSLPMKLFGKENAIKYKRTG